ncbi:hypothetical protein IKG60_01745 [Candidatus Saccharibacteria bacterium]|nr:hypothetical protein [Candidatus Saccharibacteria bacterium]
MKEKLFTVLPMSQRFSLEAGKSYTGSITIANPISATEDFSFSVTAEPLGTFGDSNSFAQEGAYSDIVKWITIDNPTGTLTPNEHQDVTFTINVPEGVPAGGQYAALVVTENSDARATENANVNNILALASVIYADVSGITTRDGSILENTIPGFSLDPNFNLATTIENRGNTHSDALITIDVKNAFTGDTVFPTGNDSGNFKELVLPETIRYINRHIDNLPPLGIFKVTQTVYFNDTVSTTEQNVVICPLWFIFLVVFVFVFILTIIFARIRHHHKKKHAQKDISDLDA